MTMELRWIILALFAAELPLFVLADGLLGAGSTTTTAISIGLLAALFASARPLARLSSIDVAFAVFVSCRK